MFIKRKTRTGKAYGYRMLLSFKTSVTYKKNVNFKPDNCVRCEAAFVGHNSIFLPDIVRCLVLIFRIVLLKTWSNLFEEHFLKENQ